MILPEDSPGSRTGGQMRFIWQLGIFVEPDLVAKGITQGVITKRMLNPEVKLQTLELA